MRALSLCLAVSLLAMGSSAASQVQAAGYSLRSVPVYQLDVESDPDPDVFSHPVDCFLTTSVEEVNAAVGQGWRNKGVACFVSPVQVPGTIPLWRLYHPFARDHLCTTSADERQQAISALYLYEGVVGYVHAKDAAVAGVVPLHRYYEGGKHSLHVYSLEALGGGTYEGVECRVWSGETTIASMTVTAPAPGEELKGASDYDISWNSSARGGYVSLSYSTDSGVTWRLISSGLANTGFATWRVPNVETRHARVRIVWTDALFGQTNVLAIAESPSDFRIAPVPLSIPRGRMTMAAARAQLPRPTSLTAKTTSASAIALSWEGVTGNVSGYIVERRSGDGPFLQVANVRAPAVTYTDDDLTPGTRYVYRVVAYGQQVNSGHSTEAAARTEPSLRARSRGAKATAAPRRSVR